MKIYTKTGDAGETALFGGGRVPKSDPRVAAYGDVDELNAWIGATRAWCSDDQIRAALERIQGELFVVGAILATPNPARRKGDRFTLEAERIDALEREIDAWDAELEELKRFILPGGGPVAAVTHLARTVCRRAEREIIALSRIEPVRPAAIRYVNRLSDYLFVLARSLTHALGEPEVLWDPASV